LKVTLQKAGDNEKEIENEFFRAFEFGGTVYKCIDYFRQKYD
jgi:hypothetical protein